jgi:hypothetical protein
MFAAKGVRKMKSLPVPRCTVGNQEFFYEYSRSHFIQVSAFALSSWLPRYCASRISLPVRCIVCVSSRTTEDFCLHSILYFLISPIVFCLTPCWLSCPGRITSPRFLAWIGFWYLHGALILESFAFWKISRSPPWQKSSITKSPVGYTYEQRI